MKVLVTGGSGFIGSHLVSHLKKCGHDVFAPDPKRFNLEELETIRNVARESSWDVVIHLAALSHVVECESNKPLARQVNVKGTEILLEGLDHSKCHFIFASTAQIYRAPHDREIADGVIFTENRELVPQNFYAQTKLEAENLIRNTNGLRFTILRLFNHTHHSQSPTIFLPYIYKQIQDGAEQIPVGNIDLERDIGSIFDLVKAFDGIIENANWDHETFNVCSGRSKNLRLLAELLVKKLNSKAQFVIDKSRIREGEPKKIVGSHQKITQVLGWRPKALSESDLIESFLCE